MSSYTSSTSVLPRAELKTHEIDFDEWRYVTGGDNCYVVSRHGRVMSCYHKGKNVPTDTWYVKKEALSAGYPIVGIVGRGLVRIHRLVAEEFLPNPLGKKQVNHRNGIKTDNRLDNLEWATVSENLTHTCRVLRKRIGENHCCAKLILEDVEHIRTLPAFGASQSKMAKMFGVNPSTIGEIIRGEIWAT